MIPAAKGQEHPLVHYRAEFPIFREKIYLNTCSLGALSTRVRDRVAHFLDQWEMHGAPAWYAIWLDTCAKLRDEYAAIIGADQDEIALHASVSTATGVLASALDHSLRNKVVTTSLDFPTVPYQWLAKAERGIELVVVDSPDGISVPLDALADAVDDRTALVATSHVFFTTGALLDLKAVAEIAHSRGALCFVDAYQSVGQIPLDVHRAGVDFLSAGGLKWLLGGPGIVFLYVRRELHETLRPSVTGWFASQRQFDFDPRVMTWHRSARRFEQGTPSVAAVHAQLGGLEIINEIGVSNIRKVTRELTDDLIDRATTAGLHPTVAADSEDRSAIVMIPNERPHEGVQRLAEADVIADARPGHVRLSPFFYNVKDDNAAAIDVLAS